MGLWSWITRGSAPKEAPATPPAPLRVPAPPTRKAPKQLSTSSIIAANSGGGKSNWGGTSDDFNQEYNNALGTVQKRSQDLYVNNPDVGGWARMRTAQCVGPVISFKSAFLPEEVGMNVDSARDLNGRMNRARMLHSVSGKLDNTGQGRTEGKLQEIALLTAFVLGSCLVHRVPSTDPAALIPLSLELIPATRIETPRDKFGDPKVSKGIRYTDDRRTKIEGYYVRKPSRSTGGDNTVFDYVYDFLPIEDVAEMRLTDIAGLDRSLPAFTCLMRTLRNKGEFTESSLASARVQSKRAINIQVEEGGNSWQRANDDQTQATPDSSDEETPASGIVTIGDAEIFYTNPGEKLVNLAANLPAPNYKEFIQVADERCARGLNTAKSRFTRTVEGSYSAGRQEEQIDQPAVDQIRESFKICWMRVHEWLVDAMVLKGLVDLPDYASKRIYYCWARVVAPGKEHINPVDTGNARKIGYGLRTLTPQQACEEDGKDLDLNLKEWAKAVRAVRDAERDENLPEGTLDFLLEAPLQNEKVNVDDANANGMEADGDPPKKNGNRIMPYLKRKGVLSVH